ncbi:TIGR04282 family arsenosugar biosynthesis glycosyltransferase [Desertibaculum subflavum]|uniref:TIGR04282 family arsenosugar biosynthesis glycosyltransferase n=1 Tax=Desertibaculum subflavum TaxID=2268458 RepID=UPI000E6611D2
MKRHLAIFLRAPELGRGKRRLARDIGDLAALRFQRAQMARLRPLVRDRRWSATLWVTPDRAALRLGRPQGRGDLGQRMARPFRRLPPGPVVLIGADIPELNAGHVWAAFRALGGSEAVFGPATDGGYWLVGLSPRARRRPPFRGVAWSTEHALADTLRQLNGAKVAQLAPLSDIDTGADFRAWKERAR